MSGLLEKDICLLLRGHRNMLILFLHDLCVPRTGTARTPLFWATFHL